LNYGSPAGSNLHTQNQFIPPPAYQPQQKTSVRFNQQPRMAGIPSYSKTVQTPPLVSLKYTF
jgi:hypothetical protein